MSDAIGQRRDVRRMVGAVIVVLAVLGLVGVQVFRLVAESSDESSLVVPAVPSGASPRPPAFVARREGTQGYSNIYKYDYVGPERCGECHARNYALWRQHPHSRMNRNVTAVTVVGDFSGARLEYGGGAAVFGTERGEYVMSLYSHGQAVRQYKVTRSVGSRFVQMYVGTQIQGPEPADDPVYTREVKLPFAYWIDRHEWYPQTYDENPDGAELDAKGELTPLYAFTTKSNDDWSRTCAKCHNTYPYALRFKAAPEGRLTGFPAGDMVFRGEPHGLANDGHGLPELHATDLVTLGISCETCHFGGREHAQNGAPVSFLPRSEDITFVKANASSSSYGRSSYAINSICRQCHNADPQGPIYPNGAASWNAREAADLLAGSCASEAACTNCHNPHEAGPTKVGEPEKEGYVAACVRCHTKLRGRDAALAHGGHAKETAVSCLDCHMPRIVHGLSSVTRSHRISSPTDPRMLEGNFPNACNLCHLDRSVAWTIDALGARWGKRPTLPAGFLVSSEPAGPAWLHHKVPVVRQVAAAAYARSPLGKASLPLLLPLLDDADPPTRMFAVLALEGIVERPIGVAEYTPWAPPAVRQRQAAEIGRQAR